ncbi:MAG: hypothetical protein A2V66_15835 [Ignavibacteria bacterium RBG_13_36_8]|nr:MAG: hypothetical protein A2V66_15835 [Ignavibacteria bacterium RBG_13_36_8]
MKRRTKIVATIGPQRTENDSDKTEELGQFVNRVIPHGQLLEKFIDAGVDVIRLNMSFASKQDPYGYNEEQYLKWLNQYKNTKAKRIAVLGDLPGPKIRLGKVSLSGKEIMRKGESLFLSFGDAPPTTPGAMVLINEKPFNKAIKGINGQTDISAYVTKNSDRPISLSIGDGKVELKIVSAKSDGIVECKILNDFINIKDISEGKGLTIKKATLEVAAFQEADKKALDFLLQKGRGILAYVAVSFAQNKHDILEVKNCIENHKVIQGYFRKPNIHKSASARVISPGVIAKIETRKAWDNIDEILDVADGIMVARGDLGEQVPPEEVPEIQKDLIRLCNARGKVVITATQMLDSMEKKPFPTRAEAADVFNAIIDGTDAVMLSGETSVGSYPIRAIKTMSSIAECAERYYFQPNHRRDYEQIVTESSYQVEKVTKRLDAEERKARKNAGRPPASAQPYYEWVADFYLEKVARSEKQYVTDRICEAACRLSEAHRYVRRKKFSADQETVNLVSKSIVIPTTSGRTVFMISRFKPKGCIIGAAHFERTYRKLIFSFGVLPLLIGGNYERSQDVIRDCLKKAVEEGILKIGDEVITTSGTPLFTPGTTNMIQLLLVTK